MPSHAFDVEIAEELNSVELAILYNHFEHWIRINHIAGRNSHEGVTWMYQPRREIPDNFPYWGEDKVYKMIRKLIDKGWLRSGNFNKKKFDRTTWFALGEKRKHRYDDWPSKAAQSSVPNGTMECAEQHNPLGEAAQPIPDTKPDTEPSSTNVEERAQPRPAHASGKSSSKRKKRKLSKDKPGAVERREAVHTTDAEHDKLVAAHGEAFAEACYDKLNNSKLANGKEYASDAHAIGNWVINAVQNDQKQGYTGTKSHAHTNVAPEHKDQYKGAF